MFKKIAPMLSLLRKDPEMLRNLIGTIALAALMTVLLAPSQYAAASGLTLDIDVQPLFDAIQDYVPLFFGILAIGGGIAIGLAIARFVINSIKDAFDGKSI